VSDIKLRDFLKEGLIIRTKYCDGPNWVTNVVYSINEDFIEVDLGLEKDYIDNLLMVGDTMKCKYTDDEQEYSFIGWITKIKADFPQSITIRVHQIEKFGNKRNSYRYDVYLCSVIKTSRSDAKGMFTIVTNISQTGVAFVMKEGIEKTIDVDGKDIANSNLFFEVYVSPENTLFFEGIIVRKSKVEKGIEYGGLITDIDLENEKKLNDLVNELANKDKEFYNKRSGFWSQNSKFNKQ
jgi:hypothetical protein